MPWTQLKINSVNAYMTIECPQFEQNSHPFEIDTEFKIIARATTMKSSADLPSVILSLSGTRDNHGNQSEWTFIEFLFVNNSASTIYICTFTFLLFSRVQCVFIIISLALHLQFARRAYCSHSLKPIEWPQATQQ